VIQSVKKSGRQRTSVELLTDKWIQENTEESFCKLLRKMHNMFIWVPVGDAHPDLYPHEYDKTLPPITFPQDDCNPGVISPFAICLHYGFTSEKLIPTDTNAHLFKNCTEFPAHIEQFSRDYIISPDQDQSKIIQSLCHKLRRHDEF
jgi:hypothetical protein